MTVGTGYLTQYEFKVDTNVFPVILQEVKGQRFRVPHANIHSCVRSRGACTPFVGSTPGLSTHTPALTGNLTTVVDGQYLLGKFAIEMKLTEGSYTVIAHTRLFILDPGQDPTQTCYPECLTKVDTAVGMLRDVVEPVASTSIDAYVSTGIVGGCMLFALASVMWAARSGRLDMDAILKALTRDEVALSVDLIIGVGDIVAFTIGFTEEVIVDNSLKDIVPAAILFLVTGWISSLASAWKNLRQFKVVYERHYRPQAYLKKQGETFLRRHASSSGSRPSVVILKLRMLTTDDGGQQLLRQCEEFRSRLRNLYFNVLTLVFSDIPLTAVGFYVILNAEGVELAVVVALCMATAMVGAKGYALTGFTEEWHRLDQAEQRVADFLRTGQKDEVEQFVEDLMSDFGIQQCAPAKDDVQEDKDPEALRARASILEENPCFVHVTI